MAAQAADRLELHNRYEDKRRQVLYEKARRSSAAAGIRALGLKDGVQNRALSTATGFGGEFTPPRWITEDWATISRAACPLKPLVTSIELPDGTMELHIPRFAGAAGVVPDQYENANVEDEYTETDQIISRCARSPATCSSHSRSTSAAH
jgi:hypothetical protein